MLNASFSESEESAEALQIEQPQESCCNDVPQASPRFDGPRTPKRKDAECAAKLNQVVECSKERNAPSETERADEKERNHYLRANQLHPEGVPKEDARGRALEHDFEIIADVDE